MKVLVIGQGGREHALVRKIKESHRNPEVYCAPGNAGIKAIAECVDIPANAIDDLVKFARDKKIDITLVGPEAPLVEGIVDRFKEEDLRIIGPDRYASQLEGCKVFSKELMKKLGIPTAEFAVFEDVGDARAYLKKSSYPIVVKAAGLAAGKGVTVAMTKAEAIEAVDSIMVQKAFGDAGAKVVIEECLEGEEASFIGIADGETVLSFASSQDHKRIFEGDKGPNTGGMGAYSPAPFVTETLMAQAEEVVFGPIIQEFKAQGHPFIGFIYAGIMLTKDGFKVLEFNVRFGDPEAQAILPRLKSDFLDLLLASYEGRLNEFKLEWNSDDCVCVVVSSGGYPGKFPKGLEITGLEDAEKLSDVEIFHAGTANKDGKVVTSGGRVLGVVATGAGLAEALNKTYEACGKINFDKMYYRKDIAHRVMKGKLKV